MTSFILQHSVNSLVISFCPQDYLKSLSVYSISCCNMTTNQQFSWVKLKKWEQLCVFVIGC